MPQSEKNNLPYAIRRKAFTLIELLVVIAIIAILAAILFPVFAQAKKAAKSTISVSNAKQLATSIHIYAGDHDDVFPMTIQSLDQDTTPGGAWWGASDFVGILQMTYPYVKSVDIWWNGQNPKLGSLKADMTPKGPNGTWGDWSKEQTILPNNIALNVWDGAAANIAPRSITAIEEPAALGVFFPVSGPVAGVATWTTNLADTQVDIDPWGSACVPDFNNPSVGGGWTPTYAQFKAHNNSSPVSFADGHSGKVKQNGWYQDPACGGVPLSWAKQRYPNRLWGYYLQGHEPVN